MQRVLTPTETRILGYLISAQGTPEIGSPIPEIMTGTGLSQNTVYTAMRKGVPGVLTCKYPTPNGGKQYYVSAESLKDADLNSPAVGKSVTYKDLPAFTGISDNVANSIDATYSAEPASLERIRFIASSMSAGDMAEHYIVGGLAIAMLAADILKGKK